MVSNFGSCNSVQLRSKDLIRVIGIGNETRSDDGVGLWIAHRLRAANVPGARIELKTGDAAALVASWTATDAVILIDAVCAGRCTFPGKIYRFNDSDQRVPDCFLSPSTHRLGLARALELARVLELLPRRFILYGIEGLCFDFGCELSPMVKEAAARVTGMVIADIFKLSGNAFT